LLYLYIVRLTRRFLCCSERCYAIIIILFAVVRHRIEISHWLCTTLMDSDEIPPAGSSAYASKGATPSARRTHARIRPSSIQVSACWTFRSQNWPPEVRRDGAQPCDMGAGASGDTERLIRSGQWTLRSNRNSYQMSLSVGTSQCPDDLATPRETINDQIRLRARSAHQAWIEHLGGPYIDRGFSPVRCLWFDLNGARWAYPPCAGDARKKVQTRRGQSRRVFWAGGLAAPRP
jgi:hypothetical protein